MTTITIKSNQDLEDFLQRVLDRISELEKIVANHDTELDVISETLFEPPNELDS